MAIEILLAQPSGFCAGVIRAIKALDDLIALGHKPIYVLHEIVHNNHVLKKFHDLGIIFTENIETIPDKSLIVFNAHGVSKKIEDMANKKKLTIVDATCPLVKKTHREIAKNEKENKHTIFIGSKKHPETIGTTGRINLENVTVIENADEIKQIQISKNSQLSYITQTTLEIEYALEIIKEIKNHFSDNIIDPLNKGICYATQNRQNAVKELIKHNIQILLVIGAKNSSNSNNLCKVGLQQGVKSFLIEDHDQIQKSWLSNVNKIGITAGASTPKTIINNVIEYLKKEYKDTTIREINTVKENIIFKPVSLPA